MPEGDSGAVGAGFAHAGHVAMHWRSHGVLWIRHRSRQRSPSRSWLVGDLPVFPSSNDMPGALLSHVVSHVLMSRRHDSRHDASQRAPHSPPLRGGLDEEVDAPHATSTSATAAPRLVPSAAARVRRGERVTRSVRVRAGVTGAR